MAAVNARARGCPPIFFTAMSREHFSLAEVSANDPKVSRDPSVHAAMPSSAPAPTLPQLQNLMKRDPDGYADEYAQRLRHFRSSLQLLEQKPSSSDGKELLPLLSFMSHVTPCYPTAGAGVAEELAALLERHHDLLDPALRRALVQALILLRNRGMFGAEPLLRLCFRLFRCRDKALRERLRHHIVADVKAVNLKRKDLALNRALQTCASQFLRAIPAAQF